MRGTARARGFVNADEPESQDICFVADNDYRRFLAGYAGDRLAAVGQGKIVDEEGRLMGRHNGYVNYTIGQRRGLGIAHEEPLFVKALDPTANRVTVAPRPALFSTSCTVGDLNWLVDPPTQPQRVYARIRYNSPGAPARLIPAGETVQLAYDEPQLAITVGQSAVFYDGEVLLGGGVIRPSNGSASGPGQQ